MRIVKTITETAEQAPCRTAAQMADVCCEDTPALPCCEKVDGAWAGLTDEEILDKLGLNLVNGRDENGMEVVIERAPRKNPCGELVTEYDVSPGRCCDEVTDIVVDDANTTDIVSPGGSGYLAIENGTGSVYWRAVSAGAYFPGGKRTLFAGQMISFYTLDSACGTLIFTANDGCSSVTIGVKVSSGKWEEIQWNDSIAMANFYNQDYDSISANSTGCGYGFSGSVNMEKTGTLYKILEYAGFVSSLLLPSPFYYYKHLAQSFLPDRDYCYPDDASAECPNVCLLSSGGCIRIGYPPEKHDRCILYLPFPDDIAETILNTPAVTFAFGDQPKQVGSYKNIFYGLDSNNTVENCYNVSGAAYYSIWKGYTACFPGQVKGKMWRWVC